MRRAPPRAGSSRLGPLAIVPEDPSGSEPSTSAPHSAAASDVGATIAFDGTDMELLQAISAGDEAAVLQLLVVGASAHARLAGTGATALYLAAERGMLRVIDQLLGMGAEVDLPTWDGTTPLSAAICAGQTPAVEALLQRGADVNKPDLSGLTPLMAAATNGDGPCCRLLLAHNAHVNTRNTSGEAVSPVARAAACTKPVHECGLTAQEVACHWLAHSVHLICTSDITTDMLLLHPFHLVKSSFTIVFKSHCTLCAQALMRASVHATSDAAHALITAGADVNAADAELTFTALMFAASQGSTECAYALLKAGANASACNKDNITALHLAARAGHEELATALLRAGANPDALDAQDHTPVSKHIVCSRLLVSPYPLCRSHVHVRVRARVLAMSCAACQRQARCGHLSHHLHRACEYSACRTLSQTLDWKTKSRTPSVSGVAAAHAGGHGRAPGRCAPAAAAQGIPHRCQPGRLHSHVHCRGAQPQGHRAGPAAEAHEKGHPTWFWYGHRAIRVAATASHWASRSPGKHLQPIRQPTAAAALPSCRQVGWSSSVGGRPAAPCRGAGEC